MRKTVFGFMVAGGCLGLLASCGGNTSKESSQAAMEQQLGQFVAESEKENPTLYLRLVSSEQTDSSTVYLAKSLKGTDTIGLQIEVMKDIEAGLFADEAVKEDKGFRTGAIKFTSVGKLSDNFVGALGEVYKLPVGGGMVQGTLSPLAFSSNKKAVDLSGNDTYSFKMFLENGVGEPAEIFAKLDLYKRTFEFIARDTTQYDRIVAAFEGK